MSLHRTIAGVLGTVWLISLVACTGEVPSGSGTSSTPTSTSSPTAITLSMYDRCEAGMSYPTVVKILGKPGTESSRSTLRMPDGSNLVTVMYIWSNPGLGGNMSAVFQNGDLKSKAQFGLK